MKLPVCLLFVAIIASPSCRGETKLPAVFSDHMVLQQKQADPVWGWDSPGAKITVTFAGQTKTADAAADGRWTVKLDPMPANAVGQSMTITGSTTKEIKDVLIGEVWLCSGQSNMTLPLHDTWNADIEAATNKFPAIRLLTVPNVGSQEPQNDFKGEWALCTPETSMTYSAIALYYGRYLHQILGVPVGLINNGWGGSNIESWMPRASLENNELFPEAETYRKKNEARAVSPKAFAKYDADVLQYQADMAEWQKLFDADPLTEVERPHRPHDPRDFLTSNSRLGNLYNGVLRPLMGYGIKGVIWYQGESNVSRFSEYGGLFNMMIRQWRQDWQQGDFPFYWIQLPYHDEYPKVPDDSAWARVREGQTKALKLPHTGQAVIIDLGEANDLHPKNKVDAAARLVRWPLANDYGMKVPFRSPEFKEMSIVENKITVHFDNIGGGLTTDHASEPKGFAVCGEDQKWVWAKAAIVDQDKVLVWSDDVKKPVALRYGWADNPNCTLYSTDGLAVTPFRTDAFDAKETP